MHSLHTLHVRRPAWTTALSTAAIGAMTIGCSDSTPPGDPALRRRRRQELVRAPNDSPTTSPDFSTPA